MNSLFAYQPNGHNKKAKPWFFGGYNGNYGNSQNQARPFYQSRSTIFMQKRFVHSLILKYLENNLPLIKNIIFGFSSSRAVKKTPSERFKLDFESYRSYRCTLTLNGYKIKNHQKISRKQLVCGLLRSELSENNNNKSPRTRCRAVLATWKSTILSRKRFVNTFILQYLENEPTAY